MEIDLNHVVSEVEEPNACNGECNKKGDASVVCCLSSSTSSCSSTISSPMAAAAAAAASPMFMELWHACAGPLITLPKKGDLVVYFPQGHLEQAASASPFPHIQVSNFDLNPQIFCKILDVQLLANKENDEVYTQLTLLPVPEPEFPDTNLEEKQHECPGMDDEEGGATPTKSTPHMFCKTLTASDTSTHGGFSVPRRAAEDCFAPLDYTQQRPSQELAAKDLHGVEWKFRHIYRGQPRRHLLTTGWTIFVSQKNLVSGDAVLFLRGANGDLRLGIRRAARPRNGLPDSVIGSQNTCRDVLSSVANAISSNSPFHIYYNPRASHAEFVVNYQEYVKSIRSQIPIGVRFKTKFDKDDSSERRFGGVVTGIQDLDIYKWPNSKWRCLRVRWDDKDAIGRHDRVSPWEIDLSVSLPPLSIPSSPRLKKLRTSLQATPPSNPIPARVGFLDFEESSRSSKVLQGQENVGLVSSHDRGDKLNYPSEFEMQSIMHQRIASHRMSNTGANNFTRAQPSNTYTGFLESNKFPKVLQGQEICSLKFLTGKSDVKLSAWGKTIGYDLLDMHQTPKANFYPLASEGTRNMYFPSNNVNKAAQDHGMLAYTNFPKEKLPLISSFNQSGYTNHEATKFNSSNESRSDSVISSFPEVKVNSKYEKDDILNGMVTDCKLFGFSLTGDTSNVVSSCSCKRICTKVHKQGNLVGRSIDLSKLNGYDDLLIEIESLFSMEGLLRDPAKGWRILFTDNENDMMVVGDDPWNDFCKMVSKIHIYTQAEVEKMMIGMINDDTQSCLEEAPQ
ncbi:hypothetical protein DCAR_0415185 [Daucus carota subsp. sativus]|uniref:Auxin response factor n=1 Tax=Daucus carota subsp. sativus TaxID=79200 RepID=A0AAF0WVW7_DAUCS|nr:PREDICTED: auxin response factor 4-like [Daucus carota subsp. sativus]WOG95856.1 hypothetical protein DCAR_0415185 [Daucus carota subsp. sativus]